MTTKEQITEFAAGWREARNQINREMYVLEEENLRLKMENKDLIKKITFFINKI